MADLLTRVQRELEERITALRPLVEEAQQLEQALEALNGAPSQAAPAVAPRPRRNAPAPADVPAPSAVPAPAADTAPAASAARSANAASSTKAARSAKGTRSANAATSAKATRSANAAASPSTAPATKAAEPAGDDPATTVRSRISREQADQRRKQALAIITENPGTTASNLALLLDTSTGTMHSLLKRLEIEGEIEKAAKGYARSKAAAS